MFQHVYIMVTHSVTITEPSYQISEYEKREKTAAKRAKRERPQSKEKKII